jgi:D-beta-D-heptose 7-phosphate kinase/D-beta-D-heptose 1-phosphate adenosyltransferase
MTANEKILRAARKVKSLRAAVRAVRRAQAVGRRVVFTNGCFDLLHRGHTRYLEQARALGDLLVVAVNSDASVRQLKGAGRPLIPAAERTEVLASLAAVDLVLIFDDLDPGRVIRAVRPDVLVKGGDWPVDQIVGADFVRSIGGKVRSLPYLKGASTSELIRRVTSAFSHQPGTRRGRVAISFQLQKEPRKPSEH